MTQAGSDERFSNYVTANRFYVEMESTITAAFTECSGLGVKIKAEPMYEGGVNDQQRVILGVPSFSNVTLKRGLTDSLVFWNWLNTTLSKTPKRRRNVNILTFNQAGETMQCWTLLGAIPVEWKAPSLQATGNSLAIEELVLAYEGLQVQAKSPGGRATPLKPGRDKLGYFS
jgi:phage tail-like protein